MDPLQQTTRWTRRLRALQLLVVAVVVLVLVASGPSDRWMQAAAYVLLALTAALRPCVSRTDRRLWVLVAVAVALRAAGSLVLVPVLQRPSLADALWLLMCGALLAALGERLRLLRPRVTPTLVLDTLLGALTVAALAVTTIHPASGRLPEGETLTATAMTDLAHPVVDAALLVAAVGLLVAASWRPPAADWLLSIGVLGIAAFDTAFLLQLGEGGSAPGSGLAALPVAATGLIVLAGWVGHGAPTRPTRTRPSGVVAPALLATACVSSFVHASLREVPPVAIALTTAGLLVAITRAVLTIVGDRTGARSVLGAKEEELLRFQALVETSADFIAIADMDRRMLYVNPAGRRMVGLAADADLTSTRIEDYLTDEGQRLSARVEQPTVIRRGWWDGESTLRHFDGGEPTPVAVSTFLMRHPQGGAPFGMATVQRDITQRIEAERALQDLADQRQVLLGRLVEAQEDERARIAADVHDDSVQSLAAVDLRLGLLRRRLADAPPEVVEDLDQLRETVTGATERLRHLLFDLESPTLTLGLGPALREAADYLLEDSGLTWEVTGQGDDGLSPAARITAYRIAKEAIFNVHRHARAQRLAVTIGSADAGALVTVSDDGLGFTPSQGHGRPGHLGLGSMRDQAVVAGGRLDVDSAPGRGTTVRLWLPDSQPPAPGVAPVGEATGPAR